jgi:Domain of unknown function (DUF3883)
MAGSRKRQPAAPKAKIAPEATTQTKTVAAVLKEDLKARGECVVEANAVKTGFFAINQNTWQRQSEEAKRDGREGPNLVVYRTKTDDPRDHYAVPFSVFCDLLVEGTLSTVRADGTRRWNLTLKNGKLHVTHLRRTIDVSRYHGARLLVEGAAPETRGRVELTDTGAVRDREVPTVVEPPPTDLGVINTDSDDQPPLRLNDRERDGLGPAINPQDLSAQVRRAEETGCLGEEAFAAWLIREGHNESDYRWVSPDNAQASYDFYVAVPRWEVAPKGLFIDVKTTRSDDSGSTIHLSLAEIHWAASHENYRIARISGLESESQRVRIRKGVHELAAAILALIDGHLPPGVRAEGFVVKVDLLEPV